MPSHNLLTCPIFFPDEDNTPVEIDPTQVEQFYLPLAKRLLTLVKNLPRLMVSVAGPPGSGKTAFTVILAAVTNALAGEELALVVGLDGWHFSNSYLASHTIERDGKEVLLSSIKGSPESFDAEAAFSCLLAIRQGKEVRFPVYSRKLHAPVADAGLARLAHKIILAEGNYLVLDEEPWKKFRGLFDLRIFLKIDPKILGHGLEERHRRGGKSPAAVTRQIQQVDLPNAQRVLHGSSEAQVIVYKVDARRIERLELGDEN